MSKDSRGRGPSVPSCSTASIALCGATLSSPLRRSLPFQRWFRSSGRQRFEHASAETAALGRTGSHRGRGSAPVLTLRSRHHGSRSVAQPWPGGASEYRPPVALGRLTRCHCGQWTRTQAAWPVRAGIAIEAGRRCWHARSESPSPEMVQVMWPRDRARRSTRRAHGGHQETARRNLQLAQPALRHGISKPGPIGASIGILHHRCIFLGAALGSPPTEARMSTMRHSLDRRQIPGPVAIPSKRGNLFERRTREGQARVSGSDGNELRRGNQR